MPEAAGPPSARRPLGHLEQGTSARAWPRARRPLRHSDREAKAARDGRSYCSRGCHCAKRG
eukprot:9190416-Pyramimonas_sp.AAC.1